ncbi:DUF418 domain-containing protein [Sphingomicrobium arenosum]|uniref:DUF418 domain-containing protein n=1 Tax=Sphingomicrobium arenosum TaxID=2233861 RepID=UPI002240514B|nr:DUF418 domain-containing protein [Sphingomicrobium arenosum]
MATTSPSSRLVSLDVIRGLAVIGIFFANVLSMGLPEDVASYPTLMGFEGMGDKLAWLFNWLFIDNRMRGLFTILFGASLVLIAERAEARGQSPWAVHVPRLATLLLIGLAHFAFLWKGDILHLYAMVGLFALLAIDHDTAALLRGAIILLVGNAVAITGLLALVTFGGEDSFVPDALSASALATERAAHSGPLAHAAYIWQTARWDPIVNTMIFSFETLGLMMLGMALLKNGFLAGTRAPRHYRGWVVIGLVMLLAMLIGAAMVARSGFDPDLTTFIRTLLGVTISPVMALSYAALLMLAIARGGWLIERLAATGRAAFTNYLGATILMTPLIFGPAWSQWSRGQLWLLAPMMGALMLLWSKPWLDRYRYGPLEWAWRSLSRGKLERLRR